MKQESWPEDFTARIPQIKISRMIKGSHKIKSFLGVHQETGEKIFVKFPATHEIKSQLEKEFLIQNFLRAASRNSSCGFEFLEPFWQGEALCYPALDASQITWLAAGSGPENSFQPLETYSREMIRFIRFCHTIRFEDLPREIQEDSSKRSKKFLEKFDTDAKYIAEKGILKNKETENIRKKVADYMDVRSFQHHDLVPWHMAKRKDSGTIILVDPEWGGWSLWGYDMAYYMLQIVGYSERPEDAKKFLAMVREEFHDTPQFENLLRCALSFRGVRLAGELLRQGKEENAREVIKIVRSGRIE